MEAAKFEFPALIVIGEVDPVTPREYARRNVGQFEEIVHLTVPHMAHGPGGMENSDCLTKILTDFVDGIATQGLDLSFVETMSPPPFRLEWELQTKVVTRMLGLLDGRLAHFAISMA